MTISNTLHHNGLKSCRAHKVPPTQEGTCTGPSVNKHLNDSEEGWKKVLWSDETKIELFGINLTPHV